MTGVWFGAMLTHCDPKKFPALEDITGERKAKPRDPEQEAKQSRVNALQWFAVFDGMERSGGGTNNTEIKD